MADKNPVVEAILMMDTAVVLFVGAAVGLFLASVMYCGPAVGMIISL